MKKTFLVALATLFSLTALADDYSLYVLRPTGETSYKFGDLQKITFSEGNVIIATKSGTTDTMPISTIERMYFDLTATGIGSTTVAPGKAGASWDGKNLKFDGVAGRIEVYQASGALVTRTTAASGTSVSLSHLPAGVYVVRMAGQSFKIVKK